MKLAVFALLVSAVTGFVTPNTGRSQTALAASSDSRREFFASAAAVSGLAVFGAALPANADRDYAGVGLLGGAEVVDVNNANVRVYLKMPGLYPTVAGKLATNGPYASVGDIYNIPGLSQAEKDVLKKYEKRFTVQPPSPEYVIDRVNNGLYR